MDRIREAEASGAGDVNEPGRRQPETRLQSEKTEGLKQSLQQLSLSTTVSGDKSEEPQYLDTFQYRPLDPGSSDIRLLKLLPAASLDDEIIIEISHVSLPAREEFEDKRLSYDDILDTLPKGWDLDVTLEGRFFFIHREEEEEEGEDVEHRPREIIVQYEHPDATVDRSIWDSEALFNRNNGYEPSYEALSYCWGSEAATSKVCIVHSNDDKSSPAILHIRPNLESALRHLRDCSLPRVLWIDAISINQTDLHERNAQVKRMTDIYAWASRVVVWIGFESVEKSAEEALKFLEKLGGQVEQGRPAIRSILSSGDEFCNITNAQIPLPCHPQDFLEIGKILHHPWWTRLWVWQEVRLGSIHTILQCGSTTVLWRDVRKAIIVLCLRDFEGANELWDVMDFDHLEYLWLFCFSNHNDNFTKLISRTNRAKYTVLHDRIFALLGLLPEEFVENVTANYSLPIEEVFRDVCLAQVGCSDSLDFLQQADRLVEEASALDLPSWIPDFTQIPKRHLIIGFATGRSHCGAVHCNEDLQLQVSAVFCGTIKCLGQTVPNQEASNDWESIISDWEEILSTTRNTSDFASDASLRRKFVDVLRTGQVDEYYDEHGEGFYGNMEENLVLYKDRNWSELLSHKLRGTAFFTTEMNFFSKGGTLGIGPPKAMPGDRIAVLLGYDFPVVLRLVTPSTRQDALPIYHLIGSAYVVDFMDTEALLGPLPEGYRIVHLVNQQGNFVQKFIDTKTGNATFVDPRLGPLPDGWHDAGMDTLQKSWFWRDGEDEGEPSTYRDPRLELDELKKRGADAKLILLA